ncbi:hypothetical protein E0485_06365 [Paenibacillus albiflavus]|uniref:LysM domain-containing protein n=1 Tax=Paenibacillus albiflavus TaxID=2545760 RepID=A0A4R4EIE9_9BACL|nr:hypothetical protein [Paenibacillus albiflavus]TCZ79477.1 hypothetical protein E0485_06365 [Paenibacillus albiflavus]
MLKKTKLIVSTLALTMAFSASAMAAAQQPTDLTTLSAEPHAKHGRHADSHSIYEEAASVLNMDKQQLMKELNSGKSLVDIAKSQNVSEEKLRASLTSKQAARIDAAVKSGKLTADKADIMKAKVNDFITQLMNKKGMLQRNHKRMLLSEDKLAKQLGLSVEELRNKLHNGKSIAELAAEKGISKDKLIESIKEDLTPMIEGMINHKNNSGEPIKGDKLK